MNSEYRHPQHDAIERRVRAGFTDIGVARELHVDRRAVSRVRRIIGMPVKTNSTSKYDKLDRFTTEPDAAGHVVWTGRTSRSGTPIIRHRDTEIPAAHIAFERRVGNKPVGMCRSDCGVKHCVADAHVQDDIERRQVRMQLRAVDGLDPEPWGRCPKGHAWWAYGRIEPDLTPYCLRCNTDRARRSRTPERNH